MQTRHDICGQSARNIKHDYVVNEVERENIRGIDHTRAL